MSNTFSIIIDSHDYEVTVYHNGDVVEVRNASGILVADAERDDGAEQIFGAVYDTESGESEFVEMPTDLYWNNDPRVTAEWLISTQLC
jgi:formylmethanofuran dehydrogenase subunit D